MLAAGVANGWPTDSYLDPAGPCQRAVRRTLDELGITVHAEVTDGCGAVNHAIALADLARILGRFAAAGGGLERRVADAMRAHPDLVAGTGRDATAIMRAIPGCLAKDGAEGVYAVGLADGRGSRSRSPTAPPEPVRSSSAHCCDAWARAPRAVGHAGRRPRPGPRTSRRRRARDRQLRPFDCPSIRVARLVGGVLGSAHEFEGERRHDAGDQSR